MGKCISGKAAAGILVHNFFHKVEVLSEENIPEDGPLLVVGNHNNQFIDAAMMLHSLPREVSFIIAEKSMHRFVVGDVARFLKAVPVVRPQDEAVQGKGFLAGVDLENLTLRGFGTAFDKEKNLTKGCKIDVKGIIEFKVVEVLSHEQISVSLLLDTDDEKAEALRNFNLALDEAKSKKNPGLVFKILPTINQAEMYKEVFSRLQSGGTIAIFPEGGSHDRTQLLPLKAGVASMALGAMSEGVQNLKILPVGINYFNASSFRSRVLVEIGTPFEVKHETFEKYKNGNRREAYQDILSDVKSGMEDVTLNTENYETLKILRTMRRLYQNGSELSAESYLKLFRRFLRGFPAWRDDPEFISLTVEVQNYLETAKTLGLSDKDVEDLPPQHSFLLLLCTIVQLFSSLLLVLLCLSFALPGLLFAYPYSLFLDAKVKKETAKALAKSKVKIQATDVAASYKVITTATYIPIVLMFQAVVALLLTFFLYNNAATSIAASTPEGYFLENVFWISALLAFFILLPLYMYICVRIVEAAILRMKLFPGRMFTIYAVLRRILSKCTTSRKLSPMADIRIRRRKLILKVQDKILELTEDNEEWKADPILPKEEIMNRREQTSAELANLLGRKLKDHKPLRMKSIHDPSFVNDLDKISNSNRNIDDSKLVVVNVESPESANET